MPLSTMTRLRKPVSCGCTARRCGSRAGTGLTIRAASCVVARAASCVVTTSAASRTLARWWQRRIGGRIPYGLAVRGISACGAVLLGSLPLVAHVWFGGDPLVLFLIFRARLLRQGTALW